MRRRTPSAEIDSPRRSVYEDADGDLHLVPDSAGMRLGDAAREIKRLAGWGGEGQKGTGDNLLWVGPAWAEGREQTLRIALELLRQAESALYRMVDELDEEGVGCQLRILEFLTGIEA